MATRLRPNKASYCWCTHSAMACILSAPFRLSSSFAPLSLPRFKIKPKGFLFSQSQVSIRDLLRVRMESSIGVEGSDSGASAEDGGAAKNSEDVLVQYVVLRRDLIDSWPLGSVVTQGCHAAVSAVWLHKEDPHTLQYCSPENIDSMHKVTLEVKGEIQMKNLSEKLKDGGIAHKLWIEQPEDFPTCLATKPYPKSVVSSFFKKLKLCK